MKYLAKVLVLILFSVSIYSQTDKRGVGVKNSTSKANTKRLALVIGNANYQHTYKLKNPVNDANDVTKALQDVGFEVISGTNLTLPKMRRLIRQFGIKLKKEKAIGLFYYAGHGIQVGGRNYLIPTDADIQTAVETPDYSVDSDLVMRYMREAGNEFNMVILDACRNNPFARTWRSYSPNRSIGDDKGLARVSPPSGTIILYATEPGKVASDGTGRNGLFTSSLLKQIKKPNVEFDAMVKLLARDIQRKSSGNQSPWREGLYFGNFYFLRGNERRKTRWESFRGMARKLSRYDEVMPYLEGLAAVRLGNKIGFIDKLGNDVIPLRFDSVQMNNPKDFGGNGNFEFDENSKFSGGLAPVKRNGKWFFIDKTGKIRISLKKKYKFVRPFEKGVAKVKMSSCKKEDCIDLKGHGFINRSGKEIVSAIYENVKRLENGKFIAVGDCTHYFLDKNGKMEKEYTSDGNELDKGPYFKVFIDDEPYYIDKLGKVVLSKKDVENINDKYKQRGQYWTIFSSFHSGIFAYKSGDKVGFLNIRGEIIVSPKYDGYESRWSLSDGVLKVFNYNNNGEKIIGFINRNGEEVISPKYDEAYPTYAGIEGFDGHWRIVKKGSGKGLITKDGKEVVPPIYDESYPLTDKLYKVSKNKKWGVMNDTSVEIVSPKYDDEFWGVFLDQGFIGVTLKGKKGFVDLEGNEYFDF